MNNTVRNRRILEAQASLAGTVPDIRMEAVDFLTLPSAGRPEKFMGLHFTICELHWVLELQPMTVDTR
jgi:hypothetical protein